MTDYSMHGGTVNEYPAGFVYVSDPEVQKVSFIVEVNKRERMRRGRENIPVNYTEISKML